MKHVLYENGKVIGSYSMKELVKMLDVSKTRIGNVVRNGGKIKNRYTVDSVNGVSGEDEENWKIDWDKTRRELLVLLRIHRIRQNRIGAAFLYLEKSRQGTESSKEETGA